MVRLAGRCHTIIAEDEGYAGIVGIREGRVQRSEREIVRQRLQTGRGRRLSSRSWHQESREGEPDEERKNVGLHGELVKVRWLLR